MLVKIDVSPSIDMRPFAKPSITRDFFAISSKNGVYVGQFGSLNSLSNAPIFSAVKLSSIMMNTILLKKLLLIGSVDCS